MQFRLAAHTWWLMEQQSLSLYSDKLCNRLQTRLIWAKDPKHRWRTCRNTRIYMLSVWLAKRYSHNNIREKRRKTEKIVNTVEQLKQTPPQTAATSRRDTSKRCMQFGLRKMCNTCLASITTGHDETSTNETKGKSGARTLATVGNEQMHLSFNWIINQYLSDIACTSVGVCARSRHRFSLFHINSLWCIWRRQCYCMRITRCVCVCESFQRFLVTQRINHGIAVDCACVSTCPVLTIARTRYYKFWGLTIVELRPILRCAHNAAATSAGR